MRIINNIKLLLSNFSCTIAPFSLSSDRTLYLPDKDGVLATTADILPPRLSRSKGGIFDHFIGNFSTTVASSAFELATVLTGTGATLGILAGEANNPGILRIQTGTTTTGAVALKTPDCIQLGGSMTYIFKCCIRLPNLPDATENFTINAGFTDRPSGLSAVTDGLVFIVDTNNAGWSVTSRSNGLGTRVNSVVGISANVWYDLEIRSNADASSADFYVNGQLLSTVTTNIPSGVGRATAIGLTIIKSAGSVSRFLDIDYMSLEWGY